VSKSIKSWQKNVGQLASLQNVVKKPYMIYNISIQEAQLLQRDRATHCYLNSCQLFIADL